MYIIGGKFKRRALLAPKSDKVRPTTSQLRETLFNICQHSIEGARFLDLFAGSGAMGLEALSRGAAHAVFVDNNRLSLSIIKKNIETLGVERQTSIYGCDALKGLQKLHTQNEQFDLIYVDPPYGAGWGRSVLEFLDSHPLLAAGGSLFIEESDLQEPPLTRLKRVDERRVGRAFLHHYKAL